MSWAAVIVTGASLAYKGISGAVQKHEANKLLKQKYPQYNIPSEITQAAGEGLPAEDYGMAQRDINRNESTAINAAQTRRGGLGMLSRIQQNANDAGLKLNAFDARQRQQNQRMLASYKDKQWQLNTKGKYDRDYNYGMQLKGAGNQNISSGVDDLISGVGSAAYRGAFNKTPRDTGMSLLSYNRAYNNPRARQYNPDYIPYDEQIPQ